MHVSKEDCKECLKDKQYIIKINWPHSMGIEYQECSKEKMEQEVLELEDNLISFAVYEIVELQIS